MEKIDEELDTVCSHWNTDDLLKYVPHKYAMDNELQNTDDLFFCVAFFTFGFVIQNNITLLAILKLNAL